MDVSLLQKNCLPCEGNTSPLTADQAKEFLKQAPGWELSEDGKKISRKWKFKNFQEAMQFVNKVVEIANAEDHHPDMHISYSRVALTLWTHAIDGLSENDFIVAAKVN